MPSQKPSDSELATSAVTNLTEFKDKKRAEKILSDLTQAQRLLSLTQHVLKPFQRYVPVNTVMIAINDNQTLVHLYIEKCKRILNGIKDD